MIGTFKRALDKVAQSSSKDWEQVIPPILQLYRARKGRDGVSLFQLLFGTTPRSHLKRVPFIDREEKERTYHPGARLISVARA